MGFEPFSGPTVRSLVKLYSFVIPPRTSENVSPSHITLYAQIIHHRTDSCGIRLGVVHRLRFCIRIEAHLPGYGAGIY